LGGTILKRAQPTGLTVFAGFAVLAGLGGAIASVQFLLGTIDLSVIPPRHVRVVIEMNQPLAVPNLLAALWFALAGAGLLFLREWARRLMEWFWWSWALFLVAFVLASAFRAADPGFPLVAGFTLASPLLVLAALIIRYLRSDGVRDACAA
jgi:hypothetical protein